MSDFEIVARANTCYVAKHLSLVPETTVNTNAERGVGADRTWRRSPIEYRLKQ
jgi:hypothetical protein